MDISHKYSFDAEGNLTGVDSGQTAAYFYDSMNQRVRIAPTRGTYEFVWDVFGRRVSTWAAATHTFVEGNVYTDSNPLAIRTSGIQFEHQNWLGTERVRTSNSGGNIISIDSLPWADGHTPSSDNGDQHDFAGMERDLEDNTEHAQYRQYSTNLGRWLSPDPTTASYDFSNPQSFNRYSYVLNDPNGLTDPSGLDGGGGGLSGLGGCVGAAATEGANVYADIGCGFSIFQLISGLFGGPSFHGTLQPRPSSNGGWDGNFGESLGIPTSVPRGNWGLALGLPSYGCEFGACGDWPGPFAGGGGNPTTQIQSLYENILEHLEKIAADPNNPAVQHWKAEIENWTKQILQKGGRRPGSLDKYLQRIIGITGSDLENLLPSPIMIVNPCVIDPLSPYCGRGVYNGPA